MIDDLELREHLCQGAQQLWLRGLIVGDGGLLSLQVHPRRYLVTPPRRRRSALRPAEVMTVDIGGQEIGASGSLDPGDWRLHRLAYQSPRPGPPAIGATIFATPVSVLALMHLQPAANALSLVPQPALPVVDIFDDNALRQALDAHAAVAIRNLGLFTIGATLSEALSLVETIELAAAVELAARRG